MTDEEKLISALAQFQQIGDAARIEFGGAADFLWKVPSFIEEQVKIEIDKLHTYFPTTGDSTHDEFNLSMRRRRWSLESHNLFGLFPHMLSSGNLSALLSLLETYLFRVCIVIEPFSLKSLQETRGSGIDRLYKFLNATVADTSTNLNLNNLSYYQEIRSASKIRNALLHASGILQLCRDQTIIRSMIENHLYLHKTDRRKNITSDNDYIIRLIPGHYGDQIVIGPTFVWRCSIYCRDFLTTLCENLASEFQIGHRTD